MEGRVIRKPEEIELIEGASLRSDLEIVLLHNLKVDKMDMHGMWLKEVVYDVPILHCTNFGVVSLSHVEHIVSVDEETLF